MAKKQTDPVTQRDLERAMEAVTICVAQHVKPLIRRVEELEATEFKFVGVWTEGLEARPGHCCSHNGGTWMCREATTSKPGTPDSGWILAAKAGRNGKDAR